MTIQMILDKREDIDKRINIVKGRVGRAFMRTEMDSVVPPDYESAQLLLTDYKNVFSADTANSGDAIYRKEKDISITQRQLRNEYNLLRSYKKSNNKYEVELHKKFSLPVACILFIMTGASLGVLSAKADLPLPPAYLSGFFSFTIF